MASWASWVDIEAVFWLFPVAFLIHDLEEILTVERWIKTNKEALRKRLGGRRFAHMILRRAEETTTARFSTIVACLFLAICAASYAAVSGSYIWFVAGLTVFLINVFTHIGRALIIGRYTPGVMTAIVVALPYSLFTYAHLFAADLITWPLVWRGLAVGLVGVGLVFLVGTYLGRMIFRTPQNKPEGRP